MSRPSFDDLTEAQKLRFGNGVGPYWLPDRLRALITDTASWFFCDASWRHHDFGYAVGGDRWDRARCDWKFFVAMLHDAVTQRWPLALVTVPTALLLSVLFYLAVRIGGQFGSFDYRQEYATLAEILSTSR
ncbi:MULTISPECIES: hypothetical protein [unclassified Phaeobacter]|uniref:hypothetical protein n=1 Tax=unclassified Phaeobacter TaxID=2621772 RepID=UPI003A8B324F